MWQLEGGENRGWRRPGEQAQVTSDKHVQIHTNAVDLFTQTNYVLNLFYIYKDISFI